MISLFHKPKVKLFDNPYKNTPAKSIGFISQFDEPFTISQQPSAQPVKNPAVLPVSPLKKVLPITSNNIVRPHHFITHLEKLKLLFKPLLEASYKSRGEAEDIGKQYGLEFDNVLSTDDTYVYYDMETLFPLVVCRGSVTAIDWLVSDTLILTGLRHLVMPRISMTQEIVKKVERKYNQIADGFGHSLGGLVIEHSGARGYILTYNKAAGLGDIKKKTDGRQIDYRNYADIVSLLAETQATQIKYIENQKGLLYSHSTDILPTTQERRRL